MARWTIVNYQKFIHNSSEKYDLSVSQARALYSEMRSRLDRPVFSSDLKNHPRIASQSLKFVMETVFTPAEEKKILREIEDYVDEEENFSEYEGALDSGEIQ